MQETKIGLTRKGERYAMLLQLEQAYDEAWQDWEACDLFSPEYATCHNAVISATSMLDKHRDRMRAHGEM